MNREGGYSSAESELLCPNAGKTAFRAKQNHRGKELVGLEFLIVFIEHFLVSEC